MNRWEKDIELWRTWKKDPSTQNTQALLKAIDPIISLEVNKQMGTIPRPVLKLKAKSLALKAMEKFDPDKARLNTYLVHQLQPLRRANMKAQNIVRMPENMQLKVGAYLDAKAELMDKKDREPTSSELADHLSWNMKEVKRMERQLHNESSTSSQVYEGMAYEADLDMKTDLVFRSLNPRDQLIFEYTVGYGGKPTLSNNEISEKLKVSAAFVSQRKKYIMMKLKELSV